MENNQLQQHVDGVAGLKKTKMSVMGIVFMLYCLTAAGAFGIEAMIPASGPGMTILILCLLPIIWVIPICLSVGELSAYMPEDSGLYVWTKKAFGEMWGFCMGWWCALSIYLGMAAYVVLVVGYTEKFLPITPFAGMCIKVGMILIFTIVNLLGIKEISIVSTIFSVIILAIFALVTIVGFANWNYNPVTPFIPEGQSIIDSIGLGICVGIWMYCGYGCISSMAGEISNPEVIPKGLKICIPVIVASYLLPTLAGLASVGKWDCWGIGGEASVDYASVLTINLGPAWGVVFLIGAIIAQCAIFNSYISAGARSFFVLGDDHLCPKFLTKLSKKRRVPYWPVLILGAITMVLCNLDFSVILTVICPLGIICYVVLAFVFLKLRKTDPIEKRGNVYCVKGGKPVIAYIVVCPIIIGIIALFVNGTEYFLIGFVSILSALLFYIVFKLSFGGLAKIDPIKYPINPKTKLARGDIGRIGYFLALFAILLFIGSLFLTWYEGSWGTGYYASVYGEESFMGNFWLMIKTARYGGIIMFVVGLVLYFVGKKMDPVNK